MIGSGLDSTGSGQDPVTCACEHGNEPPDFIKGEVFLDQVSDYQVLKKDSSP
jgi:hypothetical protein